MLVKIIWPRGFSSNVYLVEGELLVDVGMDANIVMSHPDFRKVNKIVLTHAHFDHTGAIEPLLNGIVVMAGKEEA